VRPRIHPWKSRFNLLRMSAGLSQLFVGRGARDHLAAKGFVLFLRAVDPVNPLRPHEFGHFLSTHLGRWSSLVNGIAGLRVSAAPPELVFTDDPCP
jgi:hypothetical protein